MSESDSLPGSPLMRTLSERGFVKDCTDLPALDRAASDKSIVAYIGFDATAPALHVGSLIQIMVLRHLDRCGMRPIALIGGATTQIGDPSDKDHARPMLSEEEIDRNASGIRRIIKRIAPSCRFVDNLEWFGGMGFLRFQREFGRHFSVNRMLAMESVKRRLSREQNLSALEFSYMMMQAVDFLELFRREECALQIGGSDQWSNIIAGVDLVRRVEGGDAFGLTTPLLLDPQGRKMGKTADGKAIWLDGDLTTPFDLWQFFRNVPDPLVGQFLGLFTDLPIEEVSRLGALTGGGLNDAKTLLADEAVAIVHGREESQRAHDGALAAFQGGADMSAMPSIDMPGSSTVVDALVAAGFAPSKAAARRLADGGGVKIDGETWRMVDSVLSSALPTAFRLSAGKKRVILVRVQS